MLKKLGSGYHLMEGIISEQTARNDALKHTKIQILDSLGVKIDREIAEKIINIIFIRFYTLLYNH